MHWWLRRRRMRRWRGFRGCLGLLTLEDGLECVAWLGDLGEVKLRPVVGLLLSVGATASSAVFEVFPDLFGLIGFNGAGMGLSRHADCFERVQNRPALYFQFSCQIVNSNFAHPSLFACPARLALHSSLIVAGIFIVSALTGFRDFAIQGMLWRVVVLANHDRFHRRYLHRSAPGLRQPGCLRCRYPTRFVLRVHRCR